jgi:DNA-binding transcriptional regulator YiaG
MATFAAAFRNEIRRGTKKELAKVLRAFDALRSDLRALRRDARRGRVSAAGSRRLHSPARGRRSERGAGPDIPPREVLAFRKGLGLSRHDFGKLVGISHGTVYLWEVGRVAPRGFNLEKYVRAKKKHGKKAGLPAAALKG